MFYLDTSLVVAAFTSEKRTEDARSWLDRAVPDELFISNWVETEFSSALSLKIRTQQISIEERAIIVPNWRLFVAETAAVIAVEAQDFEIATEIVSHHQIALRSGDALHIAVAQSSDCTLVTLDKRMADAAAELGVPVASIS